HRGLVPWRHLADLLAEVDINLAPLEANNPFTDAKSCLKYLEAALVGVPTVASARSDFVRAIRHGENGLLAESSDDWKESLRKLIESPMLRAEIGLAARDDVRRFHTTAARAPRLYAS